MSSFDMAEKEKILNETGRIAFTVKMAGVTIGIRTDFYQVKDYFKDYIVDAGEMTGIDFSAEVSKEDRETVKKHFKEMYGEDYKASAWYLEVIALHTFISERMPFYDVVLMHGSALAMDGEGYLFTAPSGTGKSTHAGLWRLTFGERVQMINDDKPFLICKEEGISVCGSPWMGKHKLGCNKTVPLKAIILIHRSEENRVEEVDAYKVFEFLFRQIYQNRADGELSKKTLSLMSRIVRNVKLYELYCNMDPEAAKTAYLGMC